jgi:hypothetical protein
MVRISWRDFQGREPRGQVLRTKHYAMRGYTKLVVVR